jgi:hypothetical protein
MVVAACAIVAYSWYDLELTRQRIICPIMKRSAPYER